MNDLITPKLDQPRLWIERVEIYGSIAPPELIRGIDFCKGLNVIWGVPNPERKTDDDFGIEFNGHSVGKTSLCRLIRYALGEASFGRKILEKRINSTFHANGGGAIAILVHVDGTRWSVIRPFLQGEHSKASVDLSIEELWSQSHNDVPYADFENALNEAFIMPLPAHKPSGTEQDYVWTHLLAWLSRDQEARYQSIWQWRSPRSETRGIPNFSKKKFAAQHLIRMILSLLNDAEAQISRDLDICSQDLKKLESEQDTLTKSHKDKAVFLESVLLATLPQEEQEDIDLSGNTLFNLGQALENHITSLTKEITNLSRQREVNHRNLVIYQADISSYEKEIEHIKALLTPLEKDSGEPDYFSTEDVEKRQKMERQLKNKQKCYWSGTPFIECENYKKSIEELQERYSHQFERAFVEIPNDDATENAKSVWIAQELGIAQELAEAKIRFEEANKEDEKLSELISTKESEIKSINTQNVSLQNSKAFTKGILPHDSADVSNNEQHQDILRIQELNQKIKEILDTQQELRNRLAQSQQWIWDQGDKLKSLYDRVLKNVLSPKLDAHVTLPPKHDLYFGIQESTAVLSGEAIESLSLILFDITAVLWSVEGNGSHPCFLLHDSPREADLETPVYNQLLKNIHRISMELGASNAPFQYILTTTSEPPKPLQDDGTVCLQLRAHPEKDMLFGKILNSPSLFDEETQKEQDIDPDADDFDFVT